MRPKIRVFFCGKGWNSATIKNYPYQEELSKLAEIEINQNADLIFARETPSSLSEFYKLRKPNQIKVFSATEAFAPNFNEFDFAMGFDPINYGERYLRRNTLHRFEKFFDYSPFFNKTTFDNNFESRMDASFIYSNSHAHDFRDQFYNELRKELKVDSLGKHLQNRKFPENHNDWRLNKIEIEKNYKFSISIENAFHVGYTSEKIITSFLAGSIPLYWGNPEIQHDFNAERFINLHDFEDIEAAVGFVLKLRSEPELQQKILSSPVLTPKQIANYQNSKSEFSLFFERIIESFINKKKYAPIGTFQNRIANVRRKSFEIERALMFANRVRDKLF